MKLINKKYNWVGGLIAIMAMAGCQQSAPQQAAPQRPNIVLVMADDMGWGDSGYNGSTLAKTPNLDAMAQAGTVFNRFYSAAPVCSPTRGSMLTGRHPFRYGIYYANVGHLPTSEITLAELLKEQGYRTGFFGKWHLGILTTTEKDANRGGRPQFAHEYSPPWQHGFDRVFATESKTPTYDPMVKPKEGYKPTWWDVVTDPKKAEPYGTHYWDESGAKIANNLDGDDSRVIVDRVIPFMQQAAADNAPFLAVVWAHTPHLPVVASDEDRAVIDSDDPYTSHYYGSIYAMDRELGRIRTALQQAGIADNTLLLFTSDNGPEHHHTDAPGSSGGLRGTKRSLYEGGIRVPTVVEWPGRIGSGKTLGIPAVTSDILPTVLDYAGVAYPDGRPVDGVSLRAALEGKSSVREQAIGFESAHQIAITGQRYKLIHQPQTTDADIKTRTGQNPNQAPDYQLYDLVANPQESNDLSQQKPEIVEQMKSKLDAWRKSVAESIAELQ